MKETWRVTRDLWEYNRGSNICAIRNPEGEDEEGRDGKSMQKIWQKDFWIWQKKQTCIPKNWVNYKQDKPKETQ